MARIAVLLVGADILCRIEHLGLKASVNGELSIRYLVARTLSLFEGLS